MESNNQESEYILQPEYGKWMIEVVPRNPFKLNEIFKIEKSIENLLRFMVEKVGKNSVLSMSTYPLLGVKEYYIEKNKLEMDEDITYNVYENPFSKSIFFKDVCINNHPRFGYKIF